MKITELLDRKAIMIPLETTDKADCLQQMAEGLAAAGAVTDKEAYVAALKQREATGSTGIGFQVAIPHGKSAGVARAAIAFAKPAQPLDWDSLDGQPVKAVIMIAVPEGAGNEHLQILISISRKLIDEQFRDALLSVDSADELIALLETIS